MVEQLYQVDGGGPHLLGGARVDHEHHLESCKIGHLRGDIFVVYSDITKKVLLITPKFTAGMLVVNSNRCLKID
jgi:hypothetical protein